MHRHSHFGEGTHELEFVGLQNSWNTTVNLWHCKYGGQCFSNEKKLHHTTTSEIKFRIFDKTKYTDVDIDVFESAVRRFNYDQKSIRCVTNLR